MAKPSKAAPLDDWTPTAKGITISAILSREFCEIIQAISELEDWSDTDALVEAGAQLTKDGKFVNYNWRIGTSGLVVSISRRGKTEPYLNIRKWVRD